MKYENQLERANAQHQLVVSFISLASIAVLIATLVGYYYFR